MKLLNCRNDGRGSSHAPITIDKLKEIGVGMLQFQNYHGLIAKKVKDGGRIKFETKWHHYVVFGNSVVYQFHSYMKWDIEDNDIDATEQQAIEVINNSHSDLQKQWNDYKLYEVNFFPSILPLTSEQIFLFVPHVVQKLNEPFQ